jgi:hypothetical protein
MISGPLPSVPVLVADQMAPPVSTKLRPLVIVRAPPVPVKTFIKKASVSAVLVNFLINEKGINPPALDLEAYKKGNINPENKAPKNWIIFRREKELGRFEF